MSRSQNKLWRGLQVGTFQRSTKLTCTCTNAKLRCVDCRALAVGALALGSKAAVILKSGGGLATLGALLVAGESRPCVCVCVCACRWRSLVACVQQAGAAAKSTSNNKE